LETNKQTNTKNRLQRLRKTTHDVTMWNLHLTLEQKKKVLHDDDDSWRCNVPSHFLLLTAPFPDLQNFLVSATYSSPDRTHTSTSITRAVGYE